jgi:hypothetical protein
MHKLFVPVVDQIPFVQEEAINMVRQLPSTLRHEGIGGMRGDPCDMHSARAELHHHQHIIRDQSMPGRHFHREKVRGRQDVPVDLQKLWPTHASLPPLWSGLQVMATQDVTHRNLVDAMSQVR